MRMTDNHEPQTSYSRQFLDVGYRVKITLIREINTMESQPESKQNLPPFTLETAKAKVQAAEDGWNTRDPGELLYTEDSQWRNRAEFFNGREAIKAFWGGSGRLS